MYLLDIFNGRVNRRNYLLGLILSEVGLYVVLLILDFILKPISPLDKTIEGYILLVYCLFALWFQVSLVVRRLHDVGKPGITIIYMFVPIINLILGLQLLYSPGEKKNNEFGKKPGKKIRFPHDLLRLR